MTKDDLVKEVAAHTHQGLNLVQTKEIVQATLDAIRAEMMRGGEVSVVGFGTFTTKKLAERTAMNLHTGQKIQVPAKMAPLFKPTPGFKKEIAAALPVK